MVWQRSGRSGNAPLHTRNQTDRRSAGQRDQEIAGAENARRCQPAFLNNGIFYIEVSHPAYRIALETPAIKKQLLERIQEIIGKELCLGIKFIAGGRTLPRK